MKGRTTQRPVEPWAGKHRLRRLVVVNPDLPAVERTYRDDEWEWGATQRPPFVVRAERRAANKRARRARKASR